jgi:hypothetical protein
VRKTDPAVKPVTIQPGLPAFERSTEAVIGELKRERGVGQDRGFRSHGARPVS